MSIGEVLRRLRDEFPDVTISKIRFLEAEGLVAPERTASGYRKFGAAELERLRYVLSAQRDHYLPLRVIREHLDALSRGLEPAPAAGQPPRVPERDDGPADAAEPLPELRLSRAELVANSGLDDDQLDQVVEFGLLGPADAAGHYDAAALTVARVAAQMSSYGLEPRHLRVFKSAAERQLGLIDQVTTPVAHQRTSESAARAAKLRAELVDLAARLHAALLRGAAGDPSA